MQKSIKKLVIMEEKKKEESEFIRKANDFAQELSSMIESDKRCSKKTEKAMILLASDGNRVVIGLTGSGKHLTGLILLLSESRKELFESAISLLAMKKIAETLTGDTSNEKQEQK